MTSSDSSISVNAAYQHCIKIAQNHYENFPVASWVLLRRMRYPIAAIYAFARMADDIADEGNLDDNSRIEQLDAMAAQLDAITSGNTPDDAMYIALADAIQTHNLPIELFHDLLSAFKQDVTKKRYADFGELMSYCRRSANPVGRLLLYIHGQTDRQTLGQSDAVCSALQLINFYQDLHQDYIEMGRIYIPEDEMAASFVSEKHFRSSRSDGPMLYLMRKQYERANKLLNAGAPLGKSLKGRFGFEIRLIIAAGSRIIQKLHQQNADLFSRPRLNKADWLWIVWTALRNK